MPNPIFLKLIILNNFITITIGERSLRNKPFLTIVLLNMFVASIAQILCWRFIEGTADTSIITLLIIPPLSLVTLQLIVVGSLYIFALLVYKLVATKKPSSY